LLRTPARQPAYRLAEPKPAGRRLQASGSPRGHEPDRRVERHGLPLGERRQNLSDRTGGSGANVSLLAFQRAARRPDFERALHSRIKTAPDRDVERKIAWLHRYPGEAGPAQYPMHPRFGGERQPPWNTRARLRPA